MMIKIIENDEPDHQKIDHDHDQSKLLPLLVLFSLLIGYGISAASD